MKDEIKEAVKVYNKIAEIYSKYNFDKLMQFQLNKFISLLNGKKILDAGCGPGRDVEYFLEEGLNPIGIDVSKKLVEGAKKKVPKGKFEVMDFRKMKFKASTFDGVWSMVSVSHIPNDELLPVLKEFNRVLKDKGVLYISTDEGKGSFEKKDEKYLKQKRIFYRYKQEEMENLLEEAGFKIIESSVTLDEFGRKWLEVYARKEN